ncbi:Glutamate-5-semialdehyde dehydrogenase [Stanieria cyanosphaera PCC 7437]|uniref:Gamma-glutamyl phosphate reductase n=1 Tax=Stanieria cyanosphaera (strain ATCC 29371 / PCC 7437) TaxID=111780 RepID=K9XY39_STAC7|nr:glutamate-5-semialdehyde dehydrogenase [Stanieria cyanosphaera]AFZ37021.1 Glutamate-5-semialdehyde dehydrogenase [Stanieria cyanosphaera PCC 7437]
MDSSLNLTSTTVKLAHQASRQLAVAGGLARRQGVMAMAQGLQANFDEILEANTLDLEMSREMAVPELMIDWLKLTPERLETTVSTLKQLAKIADPTRRVINARYQLEPAQTYCQLMPLGTIALIYEAFPELAAIAAGMCLKTGNSLILRGCSAASHSNIVIAKILQNALESAHLPPECLGIISSDLGASIQELVTQDQYLNLIVPYGRPSLIQQVTEQATAPVLKTAMGNCYLYWSASGDLELVRHLISDSHNSEPDPVNAIEKVIIHSQKKSSSVLSLFSSLQEQGFQLRGDAHLITEFPEYLKPARDSEWGQAYLTKTVTFRYANNLTEAIALINRYSSGHADCLVTESYEESRQFVQEVDSALVYVNASPRFSRNPNQGENIFFGISNQKGYRQGLIGLETFTTLKQIVQG